MPIMNAAKTLVETLLCFLAILETADFLELALGAG